MKKNIGVAFVTGRPQFRKVLNTYFLNWIEHDLIENEDVNIHLFVVYDVTYKNAPRDAFRQLPRKIADNLASVTVCGRRETGEEVDDLIQRGVIDEHEGELLFGDGYAKKRNAALYLALKNKMDRLMFIDDDEYPLAVTNTGYGTLSWTGQSVLGTHLRYADGADITNGMHCGYISPIPHLKFDQDLTEGDFRKFVEAISNDIISWESVKRTIIDNYGITYADQNVLANPAASIVEEEEGRKFMSGANLSIRMDRADKIPVFYNPPGARGEDAFMSTMLSDLVVKRVPCYTFHDAFSQYPHILEGVLPQKLKAADARSKETINRFARAAVGWARYKPLLTYITQRSRYESIMEDALAKLDATAPVLCSYFGTPRFKAVAAELRSYHANVAEHFKEFEATKAAWSKLCRAEAARSGEGDHRDLTATVRAS